MLSLQKWIQFLDWTNKWLSPIAWSIATLFGALWEQGFADWFIKQYPERTGLYIFFKDVIPPIFIYAFIAGGLFSSFRIFTQKSLFKLEKELKAEQEKVGLIADNIETLVNGILLRLSEKMQFTRGDPTRLTIYIHNSQGQFISFGRYTPDPSYMSKGRNLIPDNQGCVSAAWSLDWCYEGNLTYKNARKKYNLPEEIYRAQRMKALFFAVKRIENENRIPIALLVVESKEKDRFSEATIKGILSEEEAYFARIISCLRTHIPDPQDAKKRGF